MTKQERDEIKKAIHLIHHEDNYYGGMDILARLAGIKVQSLKTEPTTLAELAHPSKTEEALERRGTGPVHLSGQSGVNYD